MLNIQYDYIFGFSFYTAHYFGAWVFIAGFLMHIAIKIPRMVTGLRSLSLREVLRTNRSDTRPQPPDPDGLVAADPAEPTMSRRGALALVGSGVLLIAVLTAGQTLGGAARGAALLLPRGPRAAGDFPVNKTAVAAGITPESVGASWRLTLRGGPVGGGAGPRRAGRYAATHRAAADRLRRGVVDRADLERGAAGRAGPAWRGCPRRARRG